MVTTTSNARTIKFLRKHKRQENKAKIKAHIKECEKIERIHGSLDAPNLILAGSVVWIPGKGAVASQYER